MLMNTIFKPESFPYHLDLSKHNIDAYEVYFWIQDMMPSHKLGVKAILEIHVHAAGIQYIAIFDTPPSEETMLSLTRGEKAHLLFFDEDDWMFFRLAHGLVS